MVIAEKCGMKEESILDALEEISRKLSLLDNVELAFINEGSLLGGLKKSVTEVMKEFKKAMKSVIQECHKENLFSCKCNCGTKK